jgi:hypothetical protein
MDFDPFYWEERVANPEAFGDAEKTLWKKIEPVLNDVLDEIKKNGIIETVYVKAEMDRLGGLLKTLDKTSITNNILTHIFERPQEEQLQFFQAINPFGFKESDVTTTYMMLEGAILVLSTELFKLLLLFHMKNVSHDVSKFNSTMQNSAPRTWPMLKPFVDNGFRNAIAHGTYAFVGRKVILYRDAKLIPFEEMELDEFIMRIKEQNVLFHCLFNVIASKKKSGFFTRSA